MANINTIIASNPKNNGNSVIRFVNTSTSVDTAATLPQSKVYKASRANRDRVASASSNVITKSFIFDGWGTMLTEGMYRTNLITQDGVINSISIITDGATGNLEFDVSKNGTTIMGGNTLALVNNTKVVLSNLTGWTTAVNTDDIITIQLVGTPDTLWASVEIEIAV